MFNVFQAVPCQWHCWERRAFGAGLHGWVAPAQIARRGANVCREQIRTDGHVLQPGDSGQKQLHPPGEGKREGRRGAAFPEMSLLVSPSAVRSPQPPRSSLAGTVEEPGAGCSLYCTSAAPAESCELSARCEHCVRQQTSELTGLRQFPRMSVLGREQRDLGEERESVS